jgi:capping protein alpha
VYQKWNEEKTEGHAEGSKYRSEIEKAVRKYMETFYVNSKECASAVYEKDGTVTIIISAKRVNLGNFWTGGWKSTHTIDVTGKKSKLNTHINANVHYFEEGNVQLNTNFDESFDVKLDDAEATGKEVAEIIKNVENKFQKNMEEMYLNMHTQTFKAMRRFLPVTRTKMDWNPNAHRMVDQLTKH